MKILGTVFALVLVGCNGNKDKPVDMFCASHTGVVLYKGKANNVSVGSDYVTQFNPLEEFPQGTTIYTTFECSWKVD